MSAAIADAEPIRTTAAPAQARLALVGADSPELIAHMAKRTGGACDMACAADGEPSGGDAAPRIELVPPRTLWSPRGPASTALLTIGRPPRAIQV